MPPTGPKDAPLLILGQGPGESEAHAGLPFHGPSGSLLTRWMTRVGLKRSETRIGNVVQCWLPGNRAPTPAEIDHCWENHWADEMQGRRLVIAVGLPAMRTFSERLKVGEFERLGKGYLQGLLHPSAVLQGGWGEEPFQIKHLRRARRVLEGQDPIARNFDRPPPGVNLYPTLPELYEWYDGIGPEGVAIDVEAAGPVLTVIGLYRVDDLQGVVIRFRRRGGAVWIHCPQCRGRDLHGCDHPEDHFVEVVELLACVLANPGIPKTFHNGQAYDVPEQLERVGFIVRGFDFDTLLAMHIRLPEAKKGLEVVSCALLGISGWKRLSGDGDWK